MRFEVERISDEPVARLCLVQHGNSVDVELTDANGDDWVLLNISSDGIKRYAGLDVPGIEVDEEGAIESLEEYA